MDMLISIGLIIAWILNGANEHSLLIAAGLFEIASVIDTKKVKVTIDK